jgi:hypothetical protein
VRVNARDGRNQGSSLPLQLPGGSSVSWYVY